MKPTLQTGLTQATGNQAYLLDTNVVSAMVPGRDNHLSRETADWFLAHDEQLFLPSIVVAELAQGIAKLSRSGGIDRAKRLDLWLDGLIESFGERIISLDSTVFRLAGRMSDAAIAIGRHPGLADVAIAATAQHHRLILLTRNLKHFQPLGVACADPFARIPA